MIDCFCKEMALITKKIFLHPELNAESHRTSLYDHVHLQENPMAVLRRGQMFQMSLKFDRDFDEETDNVQIWFNYGKYSIFFNIYWFFIKFLVHDKRIGTIYHVFLGNPIVP